MKKLYSKPLICVEAMLLDQPIAATCNKDIKDEVETLMQWGYFMPNDQGITCSQNLLPSGGFDYNDDGVADSHNTVCYHSNIQQAFIS